MQAYIVPRLSRCVPIVAFLLVIATPNSSHAYPIATERVEWKISGVINDLGTIFGSPLPVAVGDAFSINLTFQLTSTYTQCSPCVGTGDMVWDGTITGFSARVGEFDLVADIGSTLPNFVILQPGDDPTEVDYVSIKLGYRGYDDVVSPVPLHYAGGVLDGAFDFYFADFSGQLLDENDGPWRRDLTMPPTWAASTNLSLFIGDRPLENNYEGAQLGLDVTSVAAVPEPPTTALLFLGCAGLVLLKRSRFA
jgi:hypothetical protein